MPKFSINRSYDKRDHGHVGDLRITLDGTLSLNDKVVGPNGTEYLLRFMGQFAQDAYAGETDLDGAKKAFKAKVAKVVDDTIGLRTGRTSADPLVMYVRAIVKAALSADNTKALKAAADANAWLDAFIAELPADKRAVIATMAKEAYEAAVARKVSARALSL